MLLNELLTLKYGKNQSDVANPNGAIPIYGTGGIMGYANNYLYNKPSILFGRKGSIGKVQFTDKPFWCVDTTFYSLINEDIVIPKYLYYKLSLVDFNEYDEGTTIPSLRSETLNKLNFSIHSIPEQQHIVDTIGSVDDLIENYEKQIVKLTNYSTLIYQKYLQNAAIDKINLGDVCEIITGKLNANESSEGGLYPFFTCSQNESRINSFAFDCKAIIIAGNGDISVKYYEGKFNAYQRTYVLQPEKYFYLFLKACEDNISDLKSSSRGSVIKFITKDMLQNISINDTTGNEDFNKKLGIIYNNIICIRKRIEKLKQEKSLLLKKYFG